MAQNDFIDCTGKEQMKESYIAAGVPVARHHMVHENGLDDARAFPMAQVGYPVIVGRTAAVVPRPPIS